MRRLSNALLPGARYDRSRLRPGVVHLGLGAFHRAHQAPVFEEVVASGDPRWGIAGVAMRSPDVVTALAAQDGLYSMNVRGGDEASPRVIGALCALYVAAHDPERVIAAIAGGDAHIVTLTVTEKGYLDHGPESPAVLLAHAIERRRVSGTGPITVMSCDNRTANGPFARSAVLAAATAAGIPDAGLRWIADEIAFPSTMVDRITPATTRAMIDETSAALGLRDEAAVWTEPFWQWVIEDRFAGARPSLPGVQLVSDVRPWEAAKLRLLNAAHSALAYGGLLRGYVYVHEALRDPDLARLLDLLWDEAAETIDQSVVDVGAYQQALVRRFANQALPHALIQIAADGSQKIPPRIFDTIADRHARGLPSPALTRVAADWLAALASVEGLVDPCLVQLCAAARAPGHGRDIVASALHAAKITDNHRPMLIETIGAALDRLHGAETVA